MVFSEFYISPSKETFIAVYDRINGIKSMCFVLSCSCDCGNQCDFEHGERVKDRYPDAKEIEREEAKALLERHGCHFALKTLNI